MAMGVMVALQVVILEHIVKQIFVIRAQLVSIVLVDSLVVMHITAHQICFL
jgi:hypothetical protein